MKTFSRFRRFVKRLRHPVACLVLGLFGVSEATVRTTTPIYRKWSTIHVDRLGIRYQATHVWTTASQWNRQPSPERESWGCYHFLGMIVATRLEVGAC